MHYTNQLQELFDLIGDAIHLIANIFDGLGLKFAGVPITFEMLFGAGIVNGSYKRPSAMRVTTVKLK